MKYGIAAVLSVAALAGASNAHAAVVSLPSNLQVLTSGNSVNVATLSFDNWGYLSSPTGVNAIKPQNVGVNALIQPNDDGVTFSTNWSATTSYEDSDITFHVHSSTPITGVDLHFDGHVTGKDMLAQVVETVMDSNQHTVAQLAVYADGTTSVLDEVDNFAAGVSYTDLYITKDISVSSLKSDSDQSECEKQFCYNNSNWGNFCDGGHGGLATISNVSNTFVTTPNTGSGIPEPASLSVLAIGATGLLLRRRKA